MQGLHVFNAEPNTNDMHEFYAKTTSCSRLGVTTSREYSFIFKINVVFDFSLLSKNGDKDAYYSRVFVVFYFT